MENRHHDKEFHYKCWLVSRLFALIGNMPKFVEKKLTEYPLTVEGIRLATTRNGVSLLDSPEEFLKVHLGVFVEKDQYHGVFSFLINAVVGVRDEILSSRSNSDLEWVCEKCLMLSDEYYWYE